MTQCGWYGLPYPNKESSEVLDWLLQFKSFDEMALAVRSCCPWDWGCESGDYFLIMSLKKGHDAAVGIDAHGACYDPIDEGMALTRSWQQIRKSHIRST